MESYEIDKMLNTSEQMQNEMHEIIKGMAKTERGKKLAYQDMVTVYLLTKIAALQNEVEYLKLINNQ